MSLTPFHHLDAGTLPAEPALVWPWAHNWGERATEGLEWKTAIHRSQNSVEQRRALRAQPRLQVSLSHLLDDTQAPTAVGLLRAWKGRPWAVPLWWAGSTLTLAAGSTLALSRPTETLWHAGQWGVIWASPTQMEVVQVSTVSTSSVTLTGAPDSSWPAGTLVLPLALCDLPDEQSASAPVGDVIRLDVTFNARPGATSTLDEPADGSFWPSTFPTGTSAVDPRDHLLDLVHNFADAAQITASSAVDVLDGEVGLVARRPSQKHPTLSWTLNLQLDGDAALAKIRKFLASHRGAAIGFYGTSPVADTSATQIVAGVASMPELRFYTDPEELFVGMSYLGEVDEPRVTQQVLDITGSNVTLASPAGLEASLLMHLDGNLIDATGSNTFTGSIGYSTAGGAWGQALYSGNSGPGIVGGSSQNMSIGGRPWTLEGRSKFTGEENGGIVLCKNYYPSQPADFSVDYVITVQSTGMGVTWKNLLYPLSASYSTTAGEWFTWAMCDDGTTLRFFINGALVGTTVSCQLASPAPVTSSAAQVSLLNGLQGFNGDNPNWSNVRYSGQLDELRMHVGTALYTESSYVVATAPFADNGGETITRSISAARMICPCRLAVDSIEIAHIVPGVAQLNLPLITTRAVLDGFGTGGGGSGAGTGWSPPELPGYVVQQGDISVTIPTISGEVAGSQVRFTFLATGEIHLEMTDRGTEMNNKVVTQVSGWSTATLVGDWLVAPQGTGWVAPTPAPGTLGSLFQINFSGWEDLDAGVSHYFSEFDLSSPISFQIRDKATSTVRRTGNFVVSLSVPLLVD